MTKSDKKIKERHESGMQLAFCKEVVRRFDYSMKVNNNAETNIWLNCFTGNEAEDKLNVKCFFDKKLFNALDYVYKETIRKKLKIKDYWKLRRNIKIF